MVWDTGHAAVHKNRNFTHLDDQFDQYMFVLRISIFEMTALISCTSNTMLDINRTYIGGERWFGIFATTALMFSPQQAPRFYKPSRWPIWSIYARSENIDIRNDGTDLVYIEYYAGHKSALYWWRKEVWNFRCNSTGHAAVHSKHRKFTHLLGWWPIRFIYVRSENIDILNDCSDLVYIEYYAW